jgi:peptidoglycan/xylan/chitin deacetylase (PgdA/CDA1 family)
VAVSLVLNYEEGGENCVLHGDSHSEAVLTDVGGEPLAGTRNLNIESNFEYGSRVGFWEILRLLQDYRSDATVYAIGMALERNLAAAAAIAASGLEVACHGQRWVDYQFVPESITGEEFFAYCKDAFDWLYRKGERGEPRMMTISLHTRIIGRPGRIGALERLLDYITGHKSVWLCNRTAIARHWIEAHGGASE